MKKYVVLSVNENPQYLFYTPLVCWAWRYFGWEPFLFYHRNERHPKLEDHRNGLGRLEQLTTDYGNNDLLNVRLLSATVDYKSETIAQVSRLYGACVVKSDSYLMTGDIDMLPLSDYWKPDESKITVWGHDLTGYQHMPICYIGMPAQRWIEVMGITSNDYNAMIKRDLDTLPQAKSLDSVKRWVTDQDLITDRINKCNFEKDFIHRGTYQNGYPIGRVDRSAWTLSHEKFIDCHMLRDIYNNSAHLKMTLDLLARVWPNENFDWFIKYTHEFKRLVNG